LSQDRPFNDRPQPAKGVAVEHSTPEPLT
jgi:hypothetical protein